VFKSSFNVKKMEAPQEEEDDDEDELGSYLRNLNQT
jgi:hypothetical protein